MKGGIKVANKVQNPYIELFEQLSIPERLEPQNIAAMLSERAALNTLPEKSSVKPEKTHYSAEKSDDVGERNITVSEGGRKRTSRVYRCVASLAACAALALGIYSYVGSGTRNIRTDDRGGGSYASDYNDVHKSFEQYYIEDAGKTLDSAIADIEHSYNESNNDPTNTDPAQEPTVPDEPPVSAAPSTEPVEPQVSGDSTVGEIPDETQPSSGTEPETNPPADEPSATEPEKVDEKLPLPEKDAVIDDGGILFGEGFALIRDSNVLRVISTAAGPHGVGYVGNIFPTFEEETSKSLAGFYTFGNRIVAVYAVESLRTPEPDSEALEDNGQSVVGELFDSLYSDTSVSDNTRSSVEVCTYEYTGLGDPMLVSTTVQGGGLIDMNFINGSLYLVTAYNDYRFAPIIGVEDLDNYVPSYTVNGVKYYVQASDIMIPDYLATTDYTVISGIGVDGSVSVKAVLGYEGRVLLRSGAVYLLGYDSVDGKDYTSVRVFSLSGGNVIYAGSVDIEGVALGGAGVSTFNGAIAVTTVRSTDHGYVTTLGIYDGIMNLISSADIPGALTTVKRDGNRIYLSDSKQSVGFDLTELSKPVTIDGTPAKNPAEGLVAFQDGYVTLTKSKDGIVLSKIIRNADNTLSLAFSEIVCSEQSASSEALENNGILFVSNDVVGVPYGFFDGLDNCYRYELFRETESGFESMGYVEMHETDDVYKPGRAVLNGGVLYVFSDGRVSALTVGDSVALLSKVDIVVSSYGGH